MYGSCNATTTRSNDNIRSGAELCSAIPAFANFGFLGSLAVDEYIYAQPLVYDGRLYVASMNNTLYAYTLSPNGDALPTPLWQTALGPAYPYIDIAGSFGANGNQIRNVGILSTPVIDTDSQTLYAVAATRRNGTYAHELHARHLQNGTALFPVPVVISAVVTGNSSDAVQGIISFNSSQHLQRPGLLLLDDTLYIAFGSHVDQSPYHGWLLAYDRKTLNQISAFATTKQASGGSIWQSGQGPSVDAAGSIFVASANAVGGPSVIGDYAEAVLKLSPAPSISVQSYYRPANYSEMDLTDTSLGSTGVLPIPGTSALLTGGKNGLLYSLDSNRLPGTAVDDTVASIWQVAPNVVWGSPVYWNSSSIGPTVYVWGQNSNLRAFSVVSGTVNTAVTASSPLPPVIAQAGGILTLSAMGGDQGVLWANAPLDASGRGALYAFNASNISQMLWSSGQDIFNLSKFAVPTVHASHVYLPTFDGALRVYGPLGNLSGPVNSTLPLAQVVSAVNAASRLSHSNVVCMLLCISFIVLNLL